MSINVSSHEPARDNSPESMLRLTSVVAVSRELYAVDPPARYTVSAAFSRRVLPAETTLIQGPATHERLSKQGYGHISLVINEARLDIVNTSLEELKAGLASLVGSLIREISEQTRHEREQRDEAALSKRRADAARKQEIETLAHDISFD
ncbi:hypothetical protein [Arthrobacter sp. Marseille-P9274]|uniref:hypothetical protein n=1 Tax=Arthrobacter sp. Marseille-P9274 TaxID=2866572 RepID=UPI0021CACAD4|nr:hypothetical protein [Arthrobacter sp. Marseille-P9274]